ncbi:hypothetical protein PILCRDRAFT_752650 [Piloderma croceum F 1598]|uniref:Uncharacterized protein n=1 Tax=Piloderma croceum (strain F 1598) TaxID=765440 RepID=A0A0C3B2S7_PILCF|nr:hypothetical protein PILCRDRAFT_752650 [Piloderma croceum F 1598]
MRDKGDTQTTPSGTETVSAEGPPCFRDNPLGPRSTNVLHQPISLHQSNNLDPAKQ